MGEKFLEELNSKDEVQSSPMAATEVAMEEALDSEIVNDETMDARLLGNDHRTASGSGGNVVQVNDEDADIGTKQLLG